MSVVILADSQGLARAKGWGNVGYEQTYPFLLDRALRRRLRGSAPLVVDRALRGRTIRHVLSDWEEEVDLKAARVVILHVGGSDCAPRILLPEEQRWVAGLPLAKVRRLVSRLEKRHRRRLLEWMPQRVSVPVARFEEQVEEAAARCRRQGRRLILVNIAYPTAHIGALTPGLMENIASYNAALARVAATDGLPLVDMPSLLPGDPASWTVDGVHLNPEAHLRLATALAGRVADWYNTAGGNR